MERSARKSEILKILLKDFTTKHTITSLAEEIKMSRVGTWKNLKKLQAEKLIVLSPIGKGKTSTDEVKLNWENVLTAKTLAIYLTEDALKNRRWLSVFSELEKEVDFLIIYGSAITFSKEANDIDIIGVVSNKKRFKEIEEIVMKIQKTQLKKIHALNFTPTEFKEELIKNRAFIDAVKKGVVLFGQEEFIKSMRNLEK